MILLVGQAPARNSDPTRAFGPEARSGRRLLELAGTTERRFAEAFETINLIDRWPGKEGEGDRFPRLVAAEVLAAIGRSVEVVFVGLAVADRMLGASVARTMRPCRWYGDCESAKLYAILPHPSGVNRWWNDEANVRLARRFLRRAVRETLPLTR